MIRQLTPEDLPLLTEWVKNDAHHQDVDPAVFSEPNTHTLVCCDQQGIVFFLRTSMVMRAEIQFNPACYAVEGKEQRKRTATTLQEVLPIVSDLAKSGGYKQIIFESLYKPLVRFFRRLGFSAADNHFLRSLK